MLDPVFLLVKGLTYLVKPAHVLLLLVAAGGLVALAPDTWRRTRRLGRGLGIGAGALALAVLLLPLGQWLARPLENRFPLPEVSPGAVAGIVVLGGAMDLDLTLERGVPVISDHAERLTTAVALARRLPDAPVLYTGGLGSLKRPDAVLADSAGAFLRDLGLPADRLVLEGRSRNTWENAALSLPLAEAAAPGDPRPWLLVTSAVHMPRAVGAFRAAGWDRLLPYPTAYRTGASAALPGVQDAVTNLSLATFAVKEYLGLLYYSVRGWSAAPFPGPGTSDDEAVDSPPGNR